MSRLLRTAALLLCVAAGPAAAAEAIVRQLAGEVSYGEKRKAVPYMTLREGDRLALEAGASLGLVYFEGARQESFRGPAAFTVGKSASRRESGPEPQVSTLAGHLAPRLARIRELAALARGSQFGGVAVRGAERSGEAGDAGEAIAPELRLLAALEAEPILAQPEPGAEGLYRFLMARAAAWERASEPARQLADLQRAAESAGGIQERLAAMRGVVIAEMSSGNLVTAIERNRAVYEAAGKAGLRGAQIQPLVQAILLHGRLGELDKAEAALQEMSGLMVMLRRGPVWIERGEIFTALYERGRALVLRDTGKYEEAEQAGVTALRAAERALADKVIDPASQGSLVEALGRELSVVQSMLGKLNDAELTARRALQLSRERMGERSGTTARSHSILARVLLERGRYAEAEREARTSVETALALRFGEASDVVWIARDALGSALTMLGRYAEADEVFAARERAIAGDPRHAQRTRPGNFAWALALIKLGRNTRAMTLLQRMISRAERLQGEASFNAAMARGMLGVALLQTGSRDKALAQFRRAVPVLLEQAYAEQKESRDGPARIARLVFVLEAYLRALEDEPGTEKVGEMFRVADFARGGQVSRALAAGAARAAVRDPGLAQLMAKREALEGRIVTLSGTLSDLLAAPEEKRLGAVIDKMSRDLADERKALARLGRQIEAEHPDYAALAAPRAVTLADARAALRPDAALVSIYLAGDRAYVWGVGPRGEPVMSVRPVGAAQFAAWVASLRKALDVGPASLETFPAFDVDTAHRVYRELLEPVRPAWQGARQLVVIPHRALGQLPFSVLVTQPGVPAQSAVRFAGYRDVAWLVRETAVVQLPAAASLVTLARLPAPKPERRPFLGFGDPVFAPGGRSAGNMRGAFGLRNLAVVRVGETAVPGGTVAPSFSKLPALPDTREEIREIASLLRADLDKEVFMGLAANEDNVKRRDLAGHRVIAFATHGLVPGDLEGLAQPALALSHPQLARVPGDGLLGMDEILGLKLDADWVVLSACNTASADGAGEEAVSGLGRSFFYAGARALLVSNWPVETVSAKLLTTQVFRAQAEAAVPRAEALRRAMLHVMQADARDGEGRAAFAYAHPMFWAPFSLVGDGN